MQMAGTVVRCQTEHRRRRLLHLLECEESRTPRNLLRASQSLPSLPDKLQSQLTPSLSCGASSPKKLLAPAAFLSPLKSSRWQRPNTAKDFHYFGDPPPRSAAATAAGVDTSDPSATPPLVTVSPAISVLKTQRGDRRGRESDTRANNQLAQQQIATEAELIRSAEKRELAHARERAVDVKSFQLEQMKLKQQQKTERKLDAKVAAEQLEWEQTQLAVADQHRQDQLLWKRSELREAQLLAMELERRRHTVAHMSKSFFDKLTVLSAPEAMEVFLAKREQLFECCMHQVHDHVGDPSELETLQASGRSRDRSPLSLKHSHARACRQAEIEEMIARAHADLTHRMRCHEREERIDADKKRALLALQTSHLAQMQQHQSDSVARRADERLERKQIAGDQDALDRRYHARAAVRKHQALALGARIAQQIRSNEDARESLAISVHGSSSPLCRTPWWSDESDERLKGFDRPAPETARPEPHAIRGKKTCRWYD